MLRWIRAAYCNYRYSRALLDKAYFEKELELATMNCGVALTRVDYWRKRLFNERHPVRIAGRIV